MPYVKPLMPGKAYGLGTASATVMAGYPAKVSGNDQFAHGDTTSACAGIVARDTASGTKVTVYMDGGIYETDVFETGIAAGDPLKIGATGKLAKSLDPGNDLLVGQAMSVSGGILVYKLFS